MAGDKKQYRNLIFDIGWVMLSYDWRTPLMECGIENEEAGRIVRELTHSPLWSLLDYGVLSTKEFIDKAALMFPGDGEAIRCFFERVKDAPVSRPEIWEKVRLLKEAGYGIYYLSNYPEQMFHDHVEPRPFIFYADGAVISYRIHMVKPEERIYRYLLDTYALKAEDCIFFDDREENCDGAERIGIRAIRIQDEKQLAGLLDDLLAGEKV